jgi:hypothetical protein
VFRRVWATERKHLPPKDVAAAGGWSDIGTLLSVYQQVDEETLREVVDYQRPRRRERKGLNLPPGEIREPVVTKSLKRAFDAASKLPPKEQDALAGAILEELAAEQRWNELFEASADQLAQLADEALAEDRAGRTKPLEESL